MSLSISQSVTAMTINLSTSLLGIGGTLPYVYSVLAGGAGGTINSATGVYTAPSLVPSDPKLVYDTIQVTDASTPTPQTATSQILIANVIGLFCDIIQKELGLDVNHVYFWDQKVMQPTDSGLYVAVSVPNPKPFGNNLKTDGTGGGLNSVQNINMSAIFDMDIISRGPDARDRKEEVVMALNSAYAQSQQELNSFYIGKLPPGARFINLSMVDGAAIPYRFKISVQVQYTLTKTKAIPYFDTFSPVQVNTNP